MLLREGPFTPPAAFQGINKRKMRIRDCFYVGFYCMITRRLENQLNFSSMITPQFLIRGTPSILKN